MIIETLKVIGNVGEAVVLVLCATFAASMAPRGPPAALGFCSRLHSTRRFEKLKIEDQ
jgi:hypothetical protein